MVKLNIKVVGTQLLVTCFWNSGTAKTGNRRRNNQENLLGFSEYLAQNQKYLLQFKQESFSLQHLMLGTIHT